jgi:hypothetical protein
MLGTQLKKATKESVAFKVVCSLMDTICQNPPAQVPAGAGSGF